MKRFKIAMVSIMAVVGLATFVAPTTAGAVNLFKEGCKSSSSAVCKEANKGAGATDNLVQNLIQTLMFILGVISVIMIIVGGIRYTTSNGDSNQVTSAKNTVLYSVVGLVVAILAYAIVGFVLDQF